MTMLVLVTDSDAAVRDRENVTDTTRLFSLPAAALT